MSEAPTAEDRPFLRELPDAGPKTADCVLLFASGRPGTVPVDTHVHRIARRMGLAPADADEETVRVHREADVDLITCGFGHTTRILLGRTVCTATSPACLGDPSSCPLIDLCDQIGIDTAAGTAGDPAEATR